MSANIQSAGNRPHKASVQFGEQVEIPLAPAHVPEKFKSAWGSLPPCCRSFYLSPGKGCCAGMAEPSPGRMLHKPAKPHAAQKTQESTTVPPTQMPQAVQALQTPQAIQPSSTMQRVTDWFKALMDGFLKDLKLILSASKPH